MKDVKSNIGVIADAEEEEDLEEFEGVGRHATFAGQTETDLSPVGDSAVGVSIEDLNLRN